MVAPTLGNSDYKNLASNKKFGDGSCCGSENTTDNNKEYSENDKEFLVITQFLRQSIIRTV